MVAAVVTSSGPNKSVMFDMIRYYDESLVKNLNSARIRPVVCGIIITLQLCSSYNEKKFFGIVLSIDEYNLFNGILGVNEDDFVRIIPIFMEN